MVTPMGEGSRPDHGAADQRAHAAACADVGKSSLVSAIRFFLAKAKSVGFRHSGTTLARFQLCTVVSGTLISLETAVNPPKSLMI